MDNRKEINYICKHCRSCLFKDKFEDMGSSLDLCFAIKPYTFYDEARILKYISGADCRSDAVLDSFYERKCPYFCDIANLRKFILSLKGGE